MTKEFWDKRYAEEESAYGSGPNDFLKEALTYLPPQGKILCIGEGEGRNALYLAQLGFQVTAVDYSVVGLNKAAARAQALGVTLKTIVADLNEFDFGQKQWDGIVSIFCHLPNNLRPKVHHQITTSLKEGGVLILEAYTPEQLQLKTGGPQDPSMLYSKEMLAEDFSALKNIAHRTCTREIHEGKYHNGLSAVVELIARRDHL